MSLTAAQIVTLACQVAKVPGYTSQAGQLLNSILSDLCQFYDLEVNRVTQTFNMATGAAPAANALTSDWLRSNSNDVFYTISGVPYFPVQEDQAQFDAHVLTAGLNGYPYNFFVDTSVSPNNMYFWVPPSGAYAVTARYFKQRADIATPESSSTVPWFPNQQYLQTALAGRLMQLADDDRAAQFLSDDDPQGAGFLLRKYLVMQGDRSSMVRTVKRDRGTFGPSWKSLPNTKNLGW